MASDKHKELIKLIPELDTPPSDSNEYIEWLKACAHLDFLKENANSDEIIMLAQSENSFVYAAVITNERLLSLDEEKLVGWDGTPSRPAASYVSGGEQNFLVQRGFPSGFSEDSDGITQMIFVRTFEGAKDDERTYFEINQDYAHVTDIHWQTEHDAFVKCENGGISHVVSAMYDQKSNALVTFLREPLEEYLAATNSSLIRKFNFTLRRDYSSNSQEHLKNEFKNFFFSQENNGNTSYAAGVQIIPPKRKSSEIFKKLNERLNPSSQKYYQFSDQKWKELIKVALRLIKQEQDWKRKMIARASK